MLYLRIVIGNFWEIHQHWTLGTPYMETESYSPGLQRKLHLSGFLNNKHVVVASMVRVLPPQLVPAVGRATELEHRFGACISHLASLFLDIEV